MLPAHVFEFIKKGLSYRNATANILVECWKHFSLPDTCPPIAHRRTYSCLPEGRFWALLGAPFPWRGEGKGRKPTSHSSFFKWLLWKCCFSIFKCLWILGLKIKKKIRWPPGLLPLACWDCGFEFRSVHGYLSVVSVVCCLAHVQVHASGWLLLERSLTESLYPYTEYVEEVKIIKKDFLKVFCKTSFIKQLFRDANLSFLCVIIQ